MEIDNPTTNELRPVAYGIPLLRLGFRPFYLGGAFFGLVAITLWLFALHGYPVAGRSVAVNGMPWHVHEMIFGFVAAIVVDFLLTAVRAWTALDTPQGASLAWLWLLWAAGRVLVWSGPQPVAAIVDSAFLPIVAIVLLCVLITARNHHKAARALKLARRSGIGLLIGVAVATIFPQRTT